MRLIDADKLKTKAYNIGKGFPQKVIHIEDVEEAETINAISIVDGKWNHINKHLWYKDEYGNIDMWRVDIGFHNGPECQLCHKSFCINCTPEYEDDNCDLGYYECSNCGEVSLDGHEKYCSNCGSKISEVIKND